MEHTSSKSSPTTLTPCSFAMSVAQPRLAMPMLWDWLAVRTLSPKCTTADAPCTGQVDVADELAGGRVQHLHRGMQVVALPPQVQQPVAGVVAVDAPEVRRVRRRMVQLAQRAAAQKQLRQGPATQSTQSATRTRHERGRDSQPELLRRAAMQGLRTVDVNEATSRSSSARPYHRRLMLVTSARWHMPAKEAAERACPPRFEQPLQPRSCSPVSMRKPPLALMDSFAASDRCTKRAPPAGAACVASGVRSSEHTARSPATQHRPPAGAMISARTHQLARD